MQERDSHLLLLAVVVGLLAVLGGGVELRPQVLELLHITGGDRKLSAQTKQESIESRAVQAPGRPGSSHTNSIEREKRKTNELVSGKQDQVGSVRGTVTARLT